jgi:hypothetical protein
MPSYSLRLYKQKGFSKNLHSLVQEIAIEAPTREEAIEKAMKAEIPAFDDSDYALLFSEDGKEFWRLDADRT